VTAWDGRFGGSGIDYGVWPNQTRSLFAADDLRPGLTTHYKNLSITQAVFAGLMDLTNAILGRVYYREATGEELRVERCLIDCGWETATVYEFCRASRTSRDHLSVKGHWAHDDQSRGVRMEAAARRGIRIALAADDVRNRPWANGPV
jgi:hypothetical protein